MMNDVRLPPNDIDAEEAVLGSLLIDGLTIQKIENTIKTEDFYFEQSQDIFAGCVALRSRREAIDQVTLAQELSRVGKLESCGGAARFSYLISICPTSLDIEHYAGIVRRLSVSRQLIQLGDRVAAIGYEALPEVNESVARVVELVNIVRQDTTIFDELVSPKDAANVIFDMIGEYGQPPKGMRWGFRDVDEMTSGIFPELVIIGSRPGVGKTQIMLDVTENLVWQGKKILFCSAEMMIKSLMERKIARELKVDIRRLRKCGLEVDIIDKLTELAGVVSEQQVYYLPQGVSSQDIYNEALKMQSTIGLDVVFVDYLQILKDCWQSGRENKAVLVGRASKILKSLVNDLGIPVICASQLNRDLERRPEDQRKPTLADLRECVTGDTFIECFDVPRRIADIYKYGKDVRVKSFKDNGGYDYIKPDMIIDTGVKDCLLIRTQSGAFIELSKDTPIKSDNGWLKASELNIGDNILIDTSASSMVSYNKEDADMVKESRKGIRFNTGRTHFQKGRIPWNKGLTKETSILVKAIAVKTSKALKGRPMPKPDNYREIMRNTKKHMVRKYDIHGYVWLYKPEYEGSKRNKLNWGRIYEHRYIMEQYLGRLLSKEEQIHHLDGNKENNDLSNLLLCKNIAEHSKIHQLEQKFVERLIREGRVYYNEEYFQFVLR